MRFMYSYIKKYTLIVLLTMALKLIAALLELLIPYVLEYMIDDVAPLGDLRLIVFWGLVMIALAVFVRTTSVAANRLSVKSARNATYEIRRDLFWHSLNLSGNQVDAFGLPSIASRMTSDSYNVQNFLRSFQTIGIRAPIMLVGGIAVTLTMDAGLASILCVMAPILLVVTVLVSRHGVPLYDKVQQSLDDVVRVMRENITGIRVIKALSKEDFEMRRFAAANETMTVRETRAGVIMALPGPIMTLTLNMGLILVVIVGAARVNSGATKPGVILAFLTYFNMILAGVTSLNRIFLMLSKATASADRIEAVISSPEGLPPIPENEAAHTLSSDKIIFDHVSFSYGEKLTANQSIHQSLSDVSFAIKEGGSLGIIGATGSGKTTVINLLMRFYDATSGHIFVDGRDVRTYGQDELHRKFGVVFQNDSIFSESVYDNVDFGRDLTESTVREAAGDAMAADFIEAYPEGFAHRVAIKGADLSGGQRQRVLIARALAAHPEILVLDDASSALDYRTDASVRSAVRERYGGTTTIVIAQRVSSVMGLDNIIMLEEGRVLGQGTHGELMEHCREYRDICLTQMGDAAELSLQHDFPHPAADPADPASQRPASDPADPAPRRTAGEDTGTESEADSGS